MCTTYKGTAIEWTRLRGNLLDCKLILNVFSFFSSVTFLHQCHLLLFDSLSAFPLVTLVYSVEYIGCNFINVFIFFTNIV